MNNKINSLERQLAEKDGIKVNLNDKTNIEIASEEQVFYLSETSGHIQVQIMYFT